MSPPYVIPTLSTLDAITPTDIYQCPGRARRSACTFSSAQYWIDDVEFEIADVARFRALEGSALTTLKH